MCNSHILKLLFFLQRNSQTHSNGKKFQFGMCDWCPISTVAKKKKRFQKNVVLFQIDIGFAKDRDVKHWQTAKLRFYILKYLSVIHILHRIFNGQLAAIKPTMMSSHLEKGTERIEISVHYLHITSLWTHSNTKKMSSIQKSIDLKRPRHDDISLMLFSLFIMCSGL